jgi:hypothetical protein
VRDGPPARRWWSSRTRRASHFDPRKKKIFCLL